MEGLISFKSGHTRVSGSQDQEKRIFGATIILAGSHCQRQCLKA